MKNAPFVLDARARDVVLEAIKGVVIHREWVLAAAHVRTEHVHVVVSCPVEPERAINDFKAWATRALRHAQLVAPDTRVWARHGSTVPLWNGDEVAAAAEYVYERQGTPMARCAFVDGSVKAATERSR